MLIRSYLNESKSLTDVLKNDWSKFCNDHTNYYYRILGIRNVIVEVVNDLTGEVRDIEVTSFKNGVPVYRFNGLDYSGNDIFASVMDAMEN